MPSISSLLLQIAEGLQCVRGQDNVELQAWCWQRCMMSMVSLSQMGLQHRCALRYFVGEIRRLSLTSRNVCRNARGTEREKRSCKKFVRSRISFIVTWAHMRCADLAQPACCPLMLSACLSSVLMRLHSLLPIRLCIAEPVQDTFTATNICSPSLPSPQAWHDLSQRWANRVQVALALH